MDFALSAKAAALLEKLGAFMDRHIYPNEARYFHEVAEGDRWEPPALMEELKTKAKEAGLWNLFLPGSASAISTMRRCAR